MYISWDKAYNEGYEAFFEGGSNTYSWADLKEAWWTGYFDAMVEDGKRQALDFVDDMKVFVAYKQIDSKA